MKDEQLDLERLIKATTVEMKSDEKELVESYLRNPKGLPAKQLAQAEKILIAKYPSLFKKTRKKFKRLAIIFTIAAFAYGLGVGGAFLIGADYKAKQINEQVEKKTEEKTSYFSFSSYSITFYPENICFGISERNDARALENYLKYIQSRDEYDQDACIKDLHELDSMDSIDGNISAKLIPEYIKKKLDLK